MASSPSQSYVYDAVASQQLTSGSEMAQMQQQNYPEVVYLEQQMGSSPQAMYTPSMKLHESMYAPSYQAYTTSSPSTLGTEQYFTDAQRIGERSAKRRIFGCTFIVFILSAAVAILAAAVIGLAAGLGVEVDRLHKAEDRADSLSSSLSSALGAKPTSTATPSDNYDSVTNNCSTRAGEVSGTTYTPQVLHGAPTFTIYCNKDATSAPILAIFAYDFNSCMDACAGYSRYIGRNVDALNLTSNGTSGGEPTWAKCEGVSFVPSWWNRNNAKANDAPGNCYLKHGPQNQSALEEPASTEVHAGIIVT